MLSKNQVDGKGFLNKTKITELMVHFFRCLDTVLCHRSAINMFSKKASVAYFTSSFSEAPVLLISLFVTTYKEKGNHKFCLERYESPDAGPAFCYIII